MRLLLLLGLACSASFASAQDLPLRVLDRDDFRIDSSCRLEIPPGLLLRDEGLPGILQIAGDDIRVEFVRGSELVGADLEGPPENRQGLGVAIGPGRNIQLIGAVVRGFRTGLKATDVEGLLLDQLEATDLFQARLYSTPAREDLRDWLQPHENDQDEWLTRYGAALWIKDCRGARIAAAFVRKSQNGIVLSRCENPVVYDSDASFLSGFGLALWRTNGGLFSRNSFDFCIRGYEHGVYNRGQDSAGILLFEQCSENVFVENSATHGGDGVFGFGGKEALQGTDAKGCNRNLFIGNDFSYAAAHGLELTFSFDNQILNNRFADNAICGIWGGYSQGFLIANNEFNGNGRAGYGLERGGINIEHGRNHWILKNRFAGDACGIHLWDDEDPHLDAHPWVQQHERGASDHWLIKNDFQAMDLGIHLRKTTRIFGRQNRFTAVREESHEEAALPMALPPVAQRPPAARTATAIGQRQAVGLRSHLAGREFIVMGEYGPFDHSSAFLRRARDSAGAEAYEFAVPRDRYDLVVKGAVDTEVQAKDHRGLRTIRIKSQTSAPTAYSLRLQSGDFIAEHRGLLFTLEWSIRAFPTPADPREDRAAFATAERSAAAVSWTQPHLNLIYGMGGPGDLPVAEQVTALKALPKDRFGTIARASITLPKGRYRLHTQSDDGISVRRNGEILLEDWTWHAPRTILKEFEVTEDKEQHFEVWHFELDGYSTLTLELEALP